MRHLFGITWSHKRPPLSLAAWNSHEATASSHRLVLLMSRQRAGYSLQELFLLSRSQLTQQRSVALSTLANILSKVGDKKTPAAAPASLSETLIESSSLSPQARGEGYGSVLTGSVLCTLLDAGLIFLLRFALDDSVEGVMSQAVHALKALLVCAEDEVRPTT